MIVNDISIGEYETKEQLVEALKKSPSFIVEDVGFDGRIYCKGWPEFTPMQNENGTWSIYNDGQLLIFE